MVMQVIWLLVIAAAIAVGWRVGNQLSNRIPSVA